MTDRHDTTLESINAIARAPGIFVPLSEQEMADLQAIADLNARDAEAQAQRAIQRHLYGHARELGALKKTESDTHQGGL